RVFARPLRGAALLSSFLAVPLLLVGWGHAASLALYTAWLAAVWLAVAWGERRPGLVAGVQAGPGVGRGPGGRPRGEGAPRGGWGHAASLALYTAWLAAVWLAVAWVERRPGLFAAFQAALSVAVVHGVTAWVEGQPWGGDYPDALWDPRSLQAYGVALAGLGLLWVAA